MVADDELLITDDDLAAVRKAVKGQGGNVTKVVEEIGVVSARFDVSDRDELVRIRDELRAAGFDAAVSPVIQSPGTDTRAQEGGNDSRANDSST